MTSSPRILQDGRLGLAVGVRLYRDADRLSKEDAVRLVEAGAKVVHNYFPRSTDITTDAAGIALLLERVTPAANDVGARRYYGSGIEALVLFEHH